MKQSSIEWLAWKFATTDIEEFKDNFNEFVNQAKQMHKQDMIDFSRECLNKAKDTDILTSFMNVEHHYKNTYEKE